MTITINNPTMERQLQSLAAKRGQNIDSYAEGLLSAGLSSDTNLQEFFDIMAGFGENKPILPPEANERSFYYEGRE